MGPTSQVPVNVQSSWHASSLTRIKVIWTPRESINKFGDSYVHFKGLGTRMTPAVMFRAAGAFYSYYFSIQHGYNHASDAFIRFNPSVFNQQVVQPNKERKSQLFIT